MPGSYPWRPSRTNRKPAMQIESIEIKNYRLFRDAKLRDIPRLCVLVGANGTGKPEHNQSHSYGKFVGGVRRVAGEMGL